MQTYRLLADLAPHFTITPAASGRGYVLTGPNGATYRLLPHATRAELFFAINVRGTNLPPVLRGRWFRAEVAA